MLILQDSAFSLEDTRLNPYRPTWTCQNTKPSNMPLCQRDQPDWVRKGFTSWVWPVWDHPDRAFRLVLREETRWQTGTPPSPADAPFHFSVVLPVCSRDYNHCVLLCICYYKSNNGRSSPTEPALCSTLLLVWRIGSNYSYKGERWQTWLKMDAKIQLSVV